MGAQRGGAKCGVQNMGHKAQGYTLWECKILGAQNMGERKVHTHTYIHINILYIRIFLTYI